VTLRPFDIELDGTRRRVVLRRAGDGWIAEIDGREIGVSVVEADGRWSMLIGDVLPPEGGSHHQHDPHVASGFLTAGALAKAVSRKSYEIAFDPVPGGELIVRVNGVAVRLTVNEPGPPKPWAKAVGVSRRGGRHGEAASGPRAIVAPMPGRIVKVLVKPDEAVVAGQPLVVVEAMKMENELRAPRAGTVADVRVAEGASVEANTVLVVLR
jgi:biotin carboxyl carrier protein